MKKPKLFPLFLLLILNTNVSLAQSDCWSFMIGSTGFEKLDAMFVDESGNVWIAGSYEGTVDFDSGPGTQSLTSTGITENFIASYISGSYRFALSMPGLLVNDIDGDAAGNVYLTGAYSGVDVDADPGTGVEPLPVFGGGNVFVVSLDNQGLYRWSNGYGSPGPDEGRSITVDPNGGIIASGSFFLTLGFEINGVGDSLTSKGGTDIFVAKFNSAGDLTAMNSYGGPGFEENPVLGAFFDPFERFWMSFAFQDSFIYEPDTLNTDMLTSNGDSDVAIAVLDAALNMTEAWSVGGPGRDSPVHLVVNDSSDDVFVAGTFRDSVDADPGPGIQILKSKGEEDIFLISHTPTGLFNSGTSAGGPLFDRPSGMGLVFSDLGTAKLLLAGEFDTSMEIESGSADPPASLTSSGFIDSYLAWYNVSTGVLEGVKQYGGLEADVSMQINPYYFAVAPGPFQLSNIKVVAAGMSSGAIDLNPVPTPPCNTPMQWSVANPGAFDLYLSTTPLAADSTTSINEEFELLPVRLFPNPAKELLILHVDDEHTIVNNLNFRIFTLQGQQIYEKNTQQRAEIQIPVHTLSAGMYLLQVADNSGRRFSSKFVKQ